MEQRPALATWLLLPEPRCPPCSLPVGSTWEQAWPWTSPHTGRCAPYWSLEPRGRAGRWPVCGRTPGGRVAHSLTAAFWGPVPTARLWEEGVGTMTLPGGCRPQSETARAHAEPGTAGAEAGDYCGLHCDPARGGPNPVPENVTPGNKITAGWGAPSPQGQDCRPSKACVWERTAVAREWCLRSPARRGAGRTLRQPSPPRGALSLQRGRNLLISVQSAVALCHGSRRALRTAVASRAGRSAWSPLPRASWLARELGAGRA